LPPTISTADPRRRGLRKAAPWIAVIGCFFAAVVALRLEGRIWFCKCGELRFWISKPSDPHTSQHLADPYSITHIEHGLLLFLALSFVHRLTRAQKWSLAVAVEVLWEIAENARFIVERYRQGAATDYFGDSVVNSLGDILACIIGYAIAEQLGRRWTVAVVVALEIALIVWIRDNLLLNGVMLVHPFEAIEHWQSAR
jgi:hypothetical protein